MYFYFFSSLLFLSNIFIFFPEFRVFAYFLKRKEGVELFHWNSSDKSMACQIKQGCCHRCHRPKKHVPRGSKHSSKPELRYQASLYFNTRGKIPTRIIEAQLQDILESEEDISKKENYYLTGIDGIGGLIETATGVDLKLSNHVKSMVEKKTIRSAIRSHYQQNTLEPSQSNCRGFSMENIVKPLFETVRDTIGGAIGKSFVRYVTPMLVKFRQRRNT